MIKKHESTGTLISTVQFAGGEPLLNLDLIERLINYTKGLNIRYQLQTNATLIDENTALRLKRLGIAIGVSLDGLPPINDSLRLFSDARGSQKEARHNRRIQSE